MEENTSYKKKYLLFFSLVLIADTVVRFIANALASNLLMLFDASDVAKYQMISSGISIGIRILAIIFALVAGHILTKDKRKTIFFAGSVFLAKQVLNVTVSSLVSSLSRALTAYGVISTMATSRITIASNILILPLMIALAYFAFTAFEGTNPKLDGGIESTDFLLRKARISFFVTYILSSVVTGALSSLPSLLYALIFQGNYNDYSMLFSLVYGLIGWAGSIAAIAITYFAGYRPYRRHQDGLAFIAVSSFAVSIGNTILSVVLLPQQMLVQNAADSQNYTRVALYSGISTAASLITSVITVLLAMWMLKFFFSAAKISLFEQEVNVETMAYQPEIIEACTEAENGEITQEAEESTDE